MIVYDVATKVLDTKSFPQHNIAGLISCITFIVLFSQEKPLRWKEINTHTHTHTHKPTLTYLVSIKTKNFKVFEPNLTRKMFFGDILWILPVDTSEFSALLQSGLT